MLNDEYRYRILKLLEAEPGASQRKLSDQLGISLGRVNYCLRALIDKGLIKANNFRNSANKRAYLYLLTPKGIEEKSRVTLRFLKHKLDEYEIVKRELEQLRLEAGELKAESPSPSAPPPEVHRVDRSAGPAKPIK